MTNDEKRLAEIRAYPLECDDTLECDVMWLLDKIAERDAEIKSLRENFADELEKMVDKNTARIAKLEEALEEIASFNNSDRADESPWIAKQALL